jgi:hypothetical protein
MPLHRLLLASIAPMKNWKTNFQWPTQKEMLEAVYKILHVYSEFFVIKSAAFNALPKQK